jgi:hypothetical protein
MKGSAWNTYPIIAPELGPLRGLVEVGTANSVATLGTKNAYLQVANNIILNDAGLPRKRPGRAAVSSFTGRTTPAWCGYGGGGLLYDADTAQLRQAGSNVQSGLTASAIAHDVFTAPNGTQYLLVCDGSTTVKKITGTTASDLTGFSALSLSPTSVAVAGTRIFFSQGSFVYFSTTNPTGGTSGEWDAVNFIQFTDPGLKTIYKLIEFGGYLYAFGNGAVGQINPREPDPYFEVVLSNFGTNGIRGVVKGRDRLYFTDGQDVYEWIPGGQPRSIAVNESGESLVRGTIRQATTNGTAYKVMGYDGFLDIVYLSNDTATLVYKPQLGAWVNWTFGSDCWTFSGGNSVHTESSLTETLTLSFNDYCDVLANTDTLFEWRVRTTNLKAPLGVPGSASREAQVRLKNVEFTFPMDISLSDSTITVDVIRNAQDYVGMGTAALTETGTFTLDSSLLDGDDILGGSGGIGPQKLAFQYPQGRTLCIEMSAEDNSPVIISTLYAQVMYL